MKRTVLIAGAVAGLFTLHCFAGEGEQERKGRLKVGDKVVAADVQMEECADGKKYSYKDVKGEKGTLVIFSCTECPVVKNTEQRITALANEYSGKGIGVLIINSNDPKVAGETAEAMKTRKERLKLKTPFVVDATSDVARAFGATKTPEAFLFNAKDELVYTGAIDDSANDPKAVEEQWLKDAMDALIAGEEIAKKESKAVGCTIKFRAKAPKQGT